MTEPRTLNDYEGWKRGLRNYDWLHRSVTGATDIDFLTERHARFLIIEGKTWTPGHGVKLPRGQDIVFRHLTAMRSHALHCSSKCTECGDGYLPFDVYLVGEEIAGNEDDDKFHLLRFGRAAPLAGTTQYTAGLFEDADRDRLRQLVHTWKEAV